MRARRYHPLAAVRIFRKYLWLLLPPLVRAVLLWQPAAFWLALRQDAALLALIIGYTLLAWRQNSWQWQAAPCPALLLRRGVFLRQALYIPPARLAFVGITRPPLLRLVGASHLVLCYRAAAYPHARAPRQLHLTLTKADAAALAAQLLCPPSPPNAQERGSQP